MPTILNAARKGEKIIIQIHSKKTFIHVIIALLKIGVCPIILPVAMTKNSANMLQKICSDNVDALIVTDNTGKVCIETFLPDIKSPIICVDEFYKEEKENETNICNMDNNTIDDVALVMARLNKESKKVEYSMMKRQKSFSYNVKNIPTLVIGSYNDQCVVMQAIKDNAKIHNAEILVLDNICHDMMLDPDWKKIAKMILNFIKKDIDKKSGDDYNDNYVSTQAHQGGE